MPPISYRKVEAGTARQFTWQASDAPNSLSLVIYTASATAVSCVAGVQSGGGMWYAFATVPDSFGNYPCYLQQQWTATYSTHAGSATLFVAKANFTVVKTKVYLGPSAS